MKSGQLAIIQSLPDVSQVRWSTPVIPTQVSEWLYATFIPDSRQAGCYPHPRDKEVTADKVNKKPSYKIQGFLKML
jgi:hypothetical protein